jgi:hypothetical protein
MAKPKDKQPWFKFYPQDWRGDAELRSCSIGARGLWVEMLCIMHQAEPYGHLLINGKQVMPRQLAKLAGISDAECMKFILELESAGVYSRADDRVIYSRRMVRDKARSEQAKEWGKGGGNPDLVVTFKGRDNPHIKGKDKPQSPEARIDDDVTRARGGLISPEAFEIADALEKACGYDLPEEIPPGWCGAAMWVQKCLSDGWIGAVMIDAARATALRAKSPIMCFKYLEKPLAQAMAEHKAPLPQVEIRQPEKLTVIANGKQQPGNILQAADRLVDTIRGFDAGPESVDQICGGEGAPNVRLLSKG